MTKLGARSRSIGSETRFDIFLGREFGKAFAVALTGAIIGYLGGMIMPPAYLYDRIFRNDPNDFNGMWLGELGGSNAILDLKSSSSSVGLISGTLQILSPNGKVMTRVPVSGSHDSDINLNASWGQKDTLKISLNCVIGDRWGPDSDFIMLRPFGDQPIAVHLCPNSNLNVGDCPKFGTGDARFTHVFSHSDVK